MRKTEIKIKDIREVIQSLSPIAIYINNEIAWKDDLDLTTLTKEEGNRLLIEKGKQYDDVLAREDLVDEINIKITDYHHSIVRIRIVDFRR